MLTLTISRVIRTPDLDSAEESQDEIVESFEDAGWVVNNVELEEDEDSEGEWEDADEIPMDMDRFTE